MLVNRLLGDLVNGCATTLEWACVNKIKHYDEHSDVDAVRHKTIYVTGICYEKLENKQQNN